MQSYITTTPFGRRSLALAHVAAQAAARARAPAAAVNKWQVFRALCAARERLALSERALAVLDALLTFHPETVLTGEDLVVFPSNAQLSLRAHGMAPSTLRRHLAALVDAGLLLRRDSPNGKRYARKGQGGEITHAFGFDLAPLLVRAAEFEELAEAERAKARALRLVKERLTLARRDLAKTIAVGLETGARLPAQPGRQSNWPALHAAFRSLVDGLSRHADLTEREQCAAALEDLAVFAARALEEHTKSEIPSANESQIEHHKQNSKPEYPTESEYPPKKAGGDIALALPLVVEACPDIADYSRSGVANWQDLLAAASVARVALGVSPNAWREACDVMGERAAATALAAILQRGEAISSPGGYLRALARKAAANEFAVAPMLTALIGRKRGSGGATASGLRRARAGIAPLAGATATSPAR